MNTRKPVLATALGLVLLSGLAFAATAAAVPPASPAVATAPAPVGPPAGFFPGAADKLNLTIEQRKTLADLHAKQQAELQVIKDTPNLTFEQRRDQSHAIAEKYRTQMHAVLTPEQQQQAGEWRKNAMQRPREGGRPERALAPVRSGRAGRRGPAVHSAPADNPLAIVAQADRIKDRMAEKLQLTDEQQDKLEHLGRAYRAQQRDAAKKHIEELRAVLTPEQQQQVEQWKQHHGRGPAGPGGKHALAVGMNDEPDDMRVAGMDFGAGEMPESPDDN